MSQEQLIDLEKKQLGLLKKIIKQHIPDKTVWAYGSRVNWKANEISDLDLTVFGCESMEIYALKEALEESNLLISVDVMNWEEIPDNFRTNIKKKYVVLQAKQELEGWREYRFSEFVQINPQVKLQSGQEYSFVEMKDLNENRKKAYSTQIRELKGGSRFINGDTLFARITPCLENGKICQVDKLKNKQGFGSTEFLVFRGKNKVSHSNFIYYLSRWQEVRSFAVLNMSGTSGRQRVSKEAFNELVFNLPPLPEQKAIAEVLSSLDDKIDLLHRQNKTLEDMAQTLFRQWFIEQADESWERKKLKYFITPKKGKNITKSQAVFGIYPIIAGGLSPSCYHNECNTQAPVITISASGANAGFVSLHHTPVWSSDSSYIDYSITSYVYFFYVFLKIHQNLITDKQEGSAQPHIYPSHLMDLDIFNYSEQLIQKFENTCANIFNKTKTNQSQISTLENLRDTLLPKLMSGEVRVSINGKKP